MAKYTAITKLEPSKIMEKAAKHFETVSGGVKVTSKTATSLCLEGPDGFVTISVCAAGGKGRKNRLDIETNQFDSLVRDFLGSI